MIVKDPMPAKSDDLYVFDEFCLDASQKALLREEKQVPLTPKVYDTLLLLLENRGMLIEKDEMMSRIWPDTVVEDSNITANIKMLRKALGDDAASPKFIETVPRRGYRFIAAVTSTSNGNRLNGGPHFSEGFKAKLVSGRVFVRSRVLIGGTILLFVTGSLFSGYLLYPARTNTAAAPILSEPFSSQQLSTNGQVLNAIITPDGRNVVYSNGIEGRQSIWIRDLETSNNVEIVPRSNDEYVSLAISPDGKFLYFVRRPKTGSVKDLFRIPIFGGIPLKIASDTEGGISISPDGGKISFVRCPYSNDEYCSLWIADASTGRDQRKLISRREPIRIGVNEFSPDGRTIAVAVGQSQNQANDFGLMQVDVETGLEHELSPERFFNIKSIAWLPNGSGLLMTASRVPNKHFRIWEVSRVGGGAQAVTTDSESYGRVSLNDEGSLLISTQGKQDFRLFLVNENDAVGKRALADASHVAVAGNGRIYFSSVMSGNDEIWSMNVDGTDRRQLTNDPADDIFPAVHNHEKIYFASNRSGRSQIWGMNIDGTDQVQVTHNEGGLPLSVSEDGKWVYYRHGVQRTLWRVSTRSGHEELVFNERMIECAVSPNGEQIAYFDRSDHAKILIIASLVDGKTVRRYLLNDGTPPYNKLTWTPDGKGIIYVLAPEGENNHLWFRSIENDETKKIADLGIETVNSISVGPDGKSYAVVQGGWKHDAVLIRGLGQRKHG